MPKSLKIGSETSMALHHIFMMSQKAETLCVEFLFQTPPTETPEFLKFKNGENMKHSTNGLRHLGADIWARDIWAQTFGREDIWAQRHLGARHLGAKCVLAHFQQSFSTSSKKIVFCIIINKRTFWILWKRYFLFAAMCLFT